MTPAEITERLRVLLDAMQARQRGAITYSDYRVFLALHSLDAPLCLPKQHAPNAPEPLLP